MRDLLSLLLLYANIIYLLIFMTECEGIYEFHSSMCRTAFPHRPEDGLQGIMRHQTWLLGTELGSTARATVDYS